MKAITIVRQDFMNKLADLVNETKELPAFVIADVLRALATQMDAFAEQQLQADLAAQKTESEEEGIND